MSQGFTLQFHFSMFVCMVTLTRARLLLSQITVLYLLLAVHAHEATQTFPQSSFLSHRSSL